MDPVSAIGIAASIATFLTIGYQVVERLKEYQLTGQEVPKALRDISVRLPLILWKVQDIEKLCSQGFLDIERSDALSRVVQGCQRQIDRLDALLLGLTPRHRTKSGRKQDSRLSLTVKGLKSIYKDKDLRNIQQALQAYESTLTFYFVVPMTIGVTDIKQSNEDFIYNVPTSACKAFVGRQSLLDSIDSTYAEFEHCQSEYNTIVLLGMGGQGKTQLALEYCRRAKSHRSIFWIDATSEAMVQRGFERFASQLLDSITMSSSTTVADVVGALENLRKPFLVIFDNFDEPHAFKDITKYMPRGHHGRFIFTSRHGDSAALGKLVVVPGMSSSEGRDLLLSRLDTQITSRVKADAEHVVELLGRLPLAIDQAASYIRARSLPLELFEEHFEMRKQHILSHTPSIWAYRRQISDQEQETKLSVFTSWELSFLHLGADEVEREPYERLLTLAAFLDSTHVGHTFFEQYHLSFGHSHPVYIDSFTTGEEWDLFKHQDALVRLRTFSLIQNVNFTNDDTIFSLHPLVSEWLKSRLSSEERERYLTEVTETLKAITLNFPKTKRSWTYGTLTEILCHIERFLSVDATTDKSQKMAMKSSKSDLLDFSPFFVKLNRLSDVEALMKVTSATELISSLELYSDSLMGEVCLFRGDIAAAEAYNVKALAEKKSVYGNTHPITLAAMEQMAFLHFTKSDFNAAQEHWQFALEAYEKSGQYYSEILGARRMLGETFRLQGDFEKASALMNEAVEGSLREWGPDHHMYARVRGSQATLLRDQGQIMSAQDIFIDCLRCYEKTFGPYQIWTKAAYLRIGIIKEDQHLMSDAKHYYSLTLNGPQPPPDPRHVPPKDPDVLLALLKRIIKDLRYWEGYLGKIITKASLANASAAETIASILQDL